MVDDNSLVEVLGEFARTLLTDFPIEAILDHLVDRIVMLLPVDGAGVTLIHGGFAPHYVAASDASALDFERLQSSLSEGPCLASYESGHSVLVPDLNFDPRFPQFGPAAVEQGLRAVFTFPLRHAQGRLGALDLYRLSPGLLGKKELQVAQTLADVTAAYLLNAQARNEARITSDQFHHNALHDPLTGLANRALLLERLEHAANRAQRSHSAAAVLFIDLDAFKLVNDRYGHDTGDQLLIGVADRLSDLIRPGDTLARPAGDEFVVLCEDLRGAADAEALADRVTVALAEPFVLNGVQHLVTASVGIAFAGPGDEVSDQLVVHADLAMYEAKRGGGNRYRITDPHLGSLETGRRSLERDLHSALTGPDPTSSGLEVHYQPVVGTAEMQLVGVEALLRWNHPERGLVSSIATTELAARCHLTDELGAWVLRRARDDYGSWRRNHPHMILDLAVTISARQLRSPGWAAGLQSAIADSTIEPARLILHVTESPAVEGDGQVRTELSALTAAGIRIALEGFGTGCSALSQLRHLPVSSVKIDRLFVADLTGDAPLRVLIHSIVDFAHGLGIAVIADGVDTVDQHRLVRESGCELGQGLHYAGPMSADAFDDYLRS